MNLKDRIQKLCKDGGVSMNKVETDLGFGKGYISKLGKSTPNATKIRAIADYFGTSVDYLMTGNQTAEGVFTCPDCGFTYVPTEYEDAKKHIEVHEAWKLAEKKFGTLYGNYRIREEIKTINRNIRDDKNSTLKERYNAELEVLRCLFSRSIENTGYDLAHVSYADYVAMMMYGKEYRKNLGNELYEKIVENFGTKPGIKDGESYYEIPVTTFNTVNKIDKRGISKEDRIACDNEQTTIAAHFDGTEYTEEELDEIRNFAEFVKNKRK